MGSAPHDAADGPAGFEHTASDEIPLLSHGESTIRVVAGAGFGHESPVSTSSPLLLAELRLDSNSPVTVDRLFAERGVLAIDAGVTLNDTPLPEGTLAVLEPNAQAVLGGRGTVMVLGGEPVGPRHIWWNFVHRDPERIEQAKENWSRQRFPRVPDDHERWVPLPT